MISDVDTVEPECLLIHLNEFTNNLQITFYPTVIHETLHCYYPNQEFVVLCNFFEMQSHVCN